MSASFDFTGYSNEVIAAQIESILKTKLDVNNYMTADNSLEGVDGMTKIVHKYVCSSEVVQDLDRGDGNTSYIEAEYVPSEYKVKRSQAATRFYDDDAYTDSKLIDAKVQYLSEAMVNNWTSKAIAEFNKTSNTSTVSTWALADWADAIAVYTNRFESQEGLFALVNIELVPAIRKALGDYLKYTEAYIRTGAIGEILGVPLYASKAVPKDIAFLATKDAVTAFLKQGTRVEQERDKNTKLNTIYADKYAVIALTDENKCIKMGKAQAVTLTAAADVSDGAITGAAATGALVTAYDADGEELGHATAASNTYSISSDKFDADDKITVVSELKGFLPSKVECTAVA